VRTPNPRFTDPPPTLGQFIEDLRAALERQGVAREAQDALPLDHIEFFPRLSGMTVKLHPRDGRESLVVANCRYVPGS
jgi:hypothetical protein